MTDPLTLQTIATLAILGFGTFQFSVALWMITRDWFASRALKDHQTILQARHEETMIRLEDRRADAQRQHESTMAGLQDQRADAQRQHEEVMAAWGAGDKQAEQSSAASSEEEIARRLQSFPPQDTGH